MENAVNFRDFSGLRAIPIGVNAKWPPPLNHQTRSLDEMWSQAATGSNFGLTGLEDKTFAIIDCDSEFECDMVNDWFDYIGIDPPTGGSGKEGHQHYFIRLTSAPADPRSTIRLKPTKAGNSHGHINVGISNYVLVYPSVVDGNQYYLDGATPQTLYKNAPLIRPEALLEISTRPEPIVIENFEDKELNLDSKSLRMPFVPIQLSKKYMPDKVNEWLTRSALQVKKYNDRADCEELVDRSLLELRSVVWGIALGYPLAQIIDWFQRTQPGHWRGRSNKKGYVIGMYGYALGMFYANKLRQHILYNIDNLYTHKFRSPYDHAILDWILRYAWQLGKDTFQIQQTRLGSDLTLAQHVISRALTRLSTQVRNKRHFLEVVSNSYQPGHRSKTYSITPTLRANQLPFDLESAIEPDPIVSINELETALQDSIS